MIDCIAEQVYKMCGCVGDDLKDLAREGRCSF